MRPVFLGDVVRVSWEGERARQERIREGAIVVSPVQELLEGLGPAAVTFGSADEIRARLDPTAAEWPKLRSALRQYANHHPRRRVRRQAGELVEAVNKAQSSTYFLVFAQFHPGVDLVQAFESADARHREAEALTEQLMAEIRSRRPFWMRFPHLRVIRLALPRARA